MLKKIIFPGLIALFIVSNAFSQDSKFGVMANLGIGSPILDNATALQMSVNPFFNVSNHLAIEGQLSVMRTIGASFLSGNEVSENLFLMGAGTRVYFTNPEKKWRPYVNLLGGIAYFVDNTEDIDNEFRPAVSFGLYLLHEKGLSLGLAAESSEHAMLKVGYKF